MKREQIEKLVSAMVALREAIPGADRFAVTAREDHGSRVAIDFESDEDVSAFAGALGIVAHRHACWTDEWCLLAFVELTNDTTVMLSGPHHKTEMRVTDEAKVDVAIADAVEASIRRGR